MMKSTIALFIHDPKCSVQSGNGIMKALGRYYNFKLFSKNPVEDGFFNDVDMIAVPGGSVIVTTIYSKITQKQYKTTSTMEVST